MVFSPDCQFIASASSDDTVRLWKPNGSSVATLSGHTDDVNDVSFSYDGKTLASVSSDSTVRLWTPNGIPIATLSGHRNVLYDVSFLEADSGVVVSSGLDGTIRLWDVTSGKLISVLEGNAAGVLDIDFNAANSQILASADGDGTVRLWKHDGIGQIAPQNKNLESLIKHACTWMSNYLNTNPKVTASEKAACEPYVQANNSNLDILGF